MESLRGLHFGLDVQSQVLAVDSTESEIFGMGIQVLLLSLFAGKAVQLDLQSLVGLVQKVVDVRIHVLEAFLDSLVNEVLLEGFVVEFEELHQVKVFFVEEKAFVSEEGKELLDSELALEGLALFPQRKVHRLFLEETKVQIGMLGLHLRILRWFFSEKSVQVEVGNIGRIGEILGFGEADVAQGSLLLVPTLEHLFHLLRRILVLSQEALQLPHHVRLGGLLPGFRGLFVLGLAGVSRGGPDDLLHSFFVQEVLREATLI